MRFRFATLLVLTLVLAVPVAPAQQPTPPAAETPPTGEPPQPLEAAAIPAAEIARNVEQSRAQLRGARDRVNAGDVTGEIAEELPAAMAEIARLKTERDGLNLRTLSLRRLEFLRQRWLRAAGRLKDWQVALDSRSSELSDTKENLAQRREVWDTTARKAADGSLPEELLTQVRDLRDSFDAMERDVDERLAGVLTMQGGVGELRTTSDEVLADLDAARAESRKRLFVADNAPLWQALSESKESRTLGEQLEGAWELTVSQFDEFLRGYGRRVPFQGMLLLGLCAGLWALYRRTRRWEEGDARARVLAILDRPLSAALLLTLLCTRLFYPRAPIFIYELNALLAVIPVLRILPRIAPRRFRAAIYGLCGLYALQQLHSLTASQPAYEGLLLRLELFVFTMLALAGLIWLIRPGGPARTWKSGAWATVALFVGDTWAVLLTGSLLANLLGAVSLAELLTIGTLISGYAATALFTAYIVLDALATLFFQSRVARTSGMVRRHGTLLRRRTELLLQAAALVSWVVATLYVFDVLEPVGSALSSVLGYSLTVGSLTVSLGAVLAFLLTIWIATLLSRTVRFVLEEDVFPRLDLPRGVGPTLSMLINYTLLALGFLAAVAAAGIELSQFTIVIGALGVGIGFGLQNIVNNFISGLILAFERPIKVGDTVQLNELHGEVRDIGIRASIVRTWDGAEVIVPNGDLISSQVINWTLSDRLRRVEITVGVKYGTDPQQVLDILIQTATAHHDVLGHPEPYALFLGFGESSLDFKLRYWTANTDRWIRHRSEITVAVNAALKEAEIEIPFPQRDLHLRSVEPSAAATLARSDRDGPPAPAPDGPAESTQERALDGPGVPGDAARPAPKT